jgi:hypothetical protein
MKTHSAMYRKFECSLLALNVLGGGSGCILGSGSLLGGSLLGLVNALGLNLLLLTCLDLLLGGFELLLAFLGLLILSSHDLVEAHANNGLLYASSLSGLALGNLVSLDFLVEASPGLSPGQLHGLLLLVEERSNLVADEEVDFTVLGGELLAFAGVDSVLRE